MAYGRGLIASRQIEQVCREHLTFMAVACGQGPDHSTLAAFVAALKEESAAIFREVLLVCAEQDFLEGTHCALDGVKLSSNAAKEWSGTVAELRRKQEKVEEKITQVLAPHETVDQEAEGSPGAGCCLEQDKVQEQLQRLERHAARIEAFLATNDPKRGTQGHEVMPTAHGVIQSYNSQALVAAKRQIIVHTEAFGNGQAAGNRGVMPGPAIW